MSARWWTLIALATASGAAPVAAQRPASEQLERAIILYEELQLERAVTLLREVLSPTQRAVTGDERVRAMKYLGAAFALSGRRDSALAHFRGALERDPFLDLDASVFTARERQIFADARQRTFVAGARVVSDTGVVPGQGRVRLQFTTTQQARLTAIVRRADDTDSLVSFQTTGVGAADASWDGLDRQGARLPAGRYVLDVTAVSVGDAAQHTVSVPLDVRYEHVPLEDTLPTLDANALLPEQRPPSAAHSRLATGVLAASFAAAVPLAFGNGALDGSRTHSVTVAAATATGGVVGFLLMRRHATIPENVRENNRRRLERLRLNEAIAARNAARLAAARMIITPAAGGAR